MSTPADRSLENIAVAVSELSSGVAALDQDVKRDGDLRSAKVKAIQRLLYVLIPCVVLLIILAVTNFLLLSRIKEAASDARSTNQIIAGCLQPNTECGKQNAARTESALNRIRETQFVIAVCQRKNPLPVTPTPADVEAQTNRLVTCVQGFYPTFKLPQKAN